MPPQKPVVLPPNIHRVTSKGKEYFYFQPGRNTKTAAKRVPLGSDPRDPAFWTRYHELAGMPQNEAERSVSAMIRAFKASAEWQTLEANTQHDYTHYFGKIEDAWGPLPAAGVRPVHVLALRDLFKNAPGSANHMVSVGKTLWKWAVPREYAAINPFREISSLKTEDDGHWPWPDWALKSAIEESWPDLSRFVYLASQTGQRESDVIRLGPAAREGKGLMVRPQKTKASRKAFWVPLLSSALIAIDGWEREPTVFSHNKRFKEPVEIPPGEHYVVSPRGQAYTTTALRARWTRWLENTDEGKAFIKRWEVWERAIRERDGEFVPPDALLKPTLHGLRSTAVVLRRLAGYSIEQISNDIGMSMPMVRRYSRFMDQRAAAESNILMLEKAHKVLQGRGKT